MSEKIVQLNEEVIKGQIKELVRSSVEETLNELLEAEAEKLTQAARYERNEARQGYRSGHYDRNLTTTSGDVTLHIPRLKGVSFETAIIERYRRRESSVEEALIEMYLAGVSVPFPVSWTVKMKKKQKETQDILSYHTQAAGCSDKARAKASGGRQPIEECGRTGL